MSYVPILSSVDILADLQEEQIEKILKGMGNRFSAVNRRVFADLEKEGIYLIDEKSLDEIQAEYIQKYFYDTIRPRIIPLLLKKKLRLVNLEDDAFYLRISPAARRHPDCLPARTCRGIQRLADASG